MEKYLGGPTSVKTKTGKNTLTITCDELKVAKDHVETTIGFCHKFAMFVSAPMCKNRVDCNTCGGKYSKT